jgi:hypothetical protein
MQVANCTEDNVTYTVGPPFDPTPLNAGSWRTDNRLDAGLIVEFSMNLVVLASSTVLTGPNVLVILHKADGHYFVTVLDEVS